MESLYKRGFILSIVYLLFLLPCFALDLDSTVNDKTRQNYTKQTQQQAQTQQQNTLEIKQTTGNETKNTEVKVDVLEIKQDLPKVPALPKNVKSSTVAPINTQYNGKMPNADALIPATDIKTGALIIDERVVKSKSDTTKQQTKQATASNKSKQTYRTHTLAKNTQIRVVNQTKITDYLSEGQTVVFTSVQDVSTSYIKLPKGTKFTAKVVDAHKPQMTCNGGLVGLKIVSVTANGYNQQINAGIIKIKTDNIHFSNLKGEHTYRKTVCKKAKWGQNIYSKWSKTAHNLANKNAGIIIAPFPYLGGCVLAAASTVSSPVTALLGKGGHLTIPANTVFTIKLYEDAKLR